MKRAANVETLSKNRLTYLRKYLQKKTRKKDRAFLVDGEKLVTEALDNGFTIDTLVYRIGTGKNIKKIIEHNRVQTVLKASESMLGRLSELETNPGLVGLVRFPQQEQLPGSDSGHMKYLALDRISDPSNLGAIIRTASWYGWDGIICGKGCVEILNGKAVRASMGAIFHMPVWEDADLPSTLDQLRENGFSAIGCVPRGGESEFACSGRFTLVIGNESKGISPDVITKCTRMVTLPGYGAMESLNAAVSAGILMDRFSRSS